MALPPLNFSAPSSSSLDSQGAMWGGASGDGDWNVNLGGASVQGGSVTTAIIILGLAWLLLRR